MLPTGTQTVIKNVAKKYKIPFANLAAVVEVESNGIVFANVDGKPEPLIRWEGHYFYKRLTGVKLQRAIDAGLASPKAGGVKNPNSQQKRWDNLLKPAMKINTDMALESISVGVGQVMLSHWKKLGFPNVSSMFTLSRSGVDGQVELMLAYCVAFNLIDELQRGDFLAFARGYNGPAQKGYDTRMKQAASKYSNVIEVLPSNSEKRKLNDMMRMGTSGPMVRDLQRLLVRAGYVVNVDGDYGPSTKQAVIAFQREQGLNADGVAGPKTMAALSAYRVSPDEELGAVSPLQAAVQTTEGRQGTAAGGAGLAVSTAADQVNNAASSLSYSGADTVAAILFSVGAILVIGGLVWAGYGWYKANKNKGIQDV